MILHTSSPRAQHAMLLYALTMRLSWFGDRSLRIEFDGASADERQGRVHAAYRHLRTQKVHALRDLTPAYRTLLLTFDPVYLEFAAAEKAVRMLLDSERLTPAAQAGKFVEVPVCYEAAHAPDLAEVASINGLSTDDVVRLHTQPEYTVCFTGFSPGFPYLAGLPAAIATPRLPHPRASVAAGSVGIAGAQTGIYPRSTAGGWRLIGRTPLRMFDGARHPPAMLAPGDRVRFVAIDSTRFAELDPAISKGEA